jgi:hypothetical protein
MKTVQVILLIGLITMGMACGYSKPATTAAQPGAIPTLSNLNPASQISGSSAFLLTVNGANFGANAMINFNGAVETTTRVSSTQLTTTISGSAIMAAGTVPVTVTNPGTPGGMYGGGTLAETSAPMNFTID